MCIGQEHFTLDTVGANSEQGIERPEQLQNFREEPVLHLAGEQSHMKRAVRRVAFLTLCGEAFHLGDGLFEYLRIFGGQLSGSLGQIAALWLIPRARARVACDGSRSPARRPRSLMNYIRRVWISSWACISVMLSDAGFNAQTARR